MITRDETASIQHIEMKHLMLLLVHLASADKDDEAAYLLAKLYSRGVQKAISKNLSKASLWTEAAVFLASRSNASSTCYY